MPIGEKSRTIVTRLAPAAELGCRSTPPEHSQAGWRPEYVFATLLLGFGIVFAIGMPPCQTPDEPSHVFRAYHLSEGHLFPERQGERGWGMVPKTLVQLTTRFAYLPFHPENQVRRQDLKEMHALSLDPQEQQPANFVGSAYYTFVPYVPQAIGMAVARALGAGPLGCSYGGRLANLALATFLVFWAIRLIPVLKSAVGMIALLPISVQQFASTSPDAPTIGAAFLLIAVLFRFALLAQAMIERRHIVAILTLGTWLTLCKFPYALIVICYWGIPSARFGSRRRYLGTGAACMAILFTLAASLTHLKKFTPPRLGGGTGRASIEAQMQFIRTHPFEYLQMFGETVTEHGKIWIDQLSMLGWLDTPVNPLAMQAFFVLLILVALSEPSSVAYPTVRFRAIALMTAALCLVVILTSCFVAGSPLHAKLIIGFQGRYLIPFLPLLLLPLRNRTIRVRACPKVLLALAASSSAAISMVAVATVLRRYYLPADMHSKINVAALLLALLLVTFVMFLATRRWGKSIRAGEIGSNAVETLEAKIIPPVHDRPTNSKARRTVLTCHPRGASSS